MFPARTSLFVRLIGLIAVLAIVVAFVAVLSLGQLRALNERAVWTADTSAARLVLAANARREMFALGQAYRDLMLADTPEDMDHFAAQIKAHEATLLGLLDELHIAVDPAHLDLIAEARTTVAELLAVAAEVESRTRLRVQEPAAQNGGGVASHEAFAVSSAAGRRLTDQGNLILSELLDRTAADLEVAQRQAAAQFTRVWMTIAVVSSISLLVTLALGWYLARRSSSRVAALVQQAELVRQTGDLSRPFHLPEGRDEFGVLADAFESMRVSLLSGQRDLREARDLLEERVRERTAALERKNEELDQFAYVASHDLKAPLRAISNLTTWIEEDAVDQLPAHVRGYLDKLRNRVARMDRLLDDLLHYSRADRIRGEVRLVDTRRLVEDVIDVLAAPGGFTFEVASDLPSIYAAQAPLEMVFRNLIGNAVKHARSDHASVRVSARRDAEGGDWEFAVSDNGPGIAPEFHERVFQMFQTLRPRDEVEGSGMGLALVKKAVESRGGKVRLDSAVGAGATIYFTWPEDEQPESEEDRPGPARTSAVAVATEAAGAAETAAAAADRAAAAAAESLNRNDGGNGRSRNNGHGPTAVSDASEAAALSRESV